MAAAASDSGAPVERPLLWCGGSGVVLAVEGRVLFLVLVYVLLLDCVVAHDKPSHNGVRLPVTYWFLRGPGDGVCVALCWWTLPSSLCVIEGILTKSDSWVSLAVLFLLSGVAGVVLAFGVVVLAERCGRCCARFWGRGSGFPRLGLRAQVGSCGG